MKLKDSVIVVTGGASGIGEAMSKRFAKERPHGIVVADINGDGANRVAKEINGYAVSLDVGNEEEINRLVKETELKYGPINLFCSNAGIAFPSDPLSTSLDSWHKQLQINLMAHVYAMRAVMPGMLDRGEGYLFFTSSLAGILSIHGDLLYAVTKHALVGLAEWLSITYHHRGIRVSCLCPGGVRTPMLDINSPFAKYAAGPIHSPEEVAEIVLEAIFEERFLVLTDPVALDWIVQKAQDLERWLKGMRRLQTKIEEESAIYKKEQ
jgi:NAD(P)-dependent dehydrogenase (short-subunit alcohol dehydrogenase family)